MSTRYKMWIAFQESSLKFSKKRPFDQTQLGRRRIELRQYYTGEVSNSDLISYEGQGFMLTMLKSAGISIISGRE